MHFVVESLALWDGARIVVGDPLLFFLIGIIKVATTPVSQALVYLPIVGLCVMSSCG